MFPISNIHRIALSKLVSSAYSAVSLFQAGIPKSTSVAVKPADFTPCLRFAVCSDVHLSGKNGSKEEIRLARMIKTVYRYAESQPYKGFDALCVAGDMTDQGKPEQYRQFKKITEENLKPDTKLLICAGNHEYIAYRDVDASEGTRVFEREMNQKDDTSLTLNGYRFILASYSRDGKTFTAKLDWLNNEIEKAVKESGEKPVFVFQHPAPFPTVYGSITWGDFKIPSVLSKYPQVIDFSGHSHYPINDPRSVYQGRFTTLGCGTLSYFETDLDYIAGNFPYENENAAQFYIVEADAAGNVFVQKYDLITDAFFDNPYYFTKLFEKNYDYTFLKGKRRDKKPIFPENPNIKIADNNKGETLLTFPGAKDKYITESYKTELFCNGISKYHGNFSGKYMYLSQKDEYTVNLGKLQAGKKYTFIATAVNAYSRCSKPLVYRFTAK